MAKVTRPVQSEAIATKKGSKNCSLKIKKSRKKKSIHANTFEERQLNRKKKEEAAFRKKIKKDTRLLSQTKTKEILIDVNTWVTDNPIHPSTIAHPTQLKDKQNSQTRYGKTYKAFIRNLPKNVTGEEIDKHFTKSGVNSTYIRILTHRVTNKCMGWAFLEFNNKLDFEKALTLNVSKFKDDRILVEGSLRCFVPSKRRPQKLVTYKPPENRQVPPMTHELENMDDDDIMEIDV